MFFDFDVGVLIFMASKCLDFLDVLSILHNDGCIVRTEPSVFGRPLYRVYLPDDKLDVFCGRITDACAEKLWALGFLYAPRGPKTTDSGDVITVFKLHKPDVSSFRKSSVQADDNK